MDQVRRRAKQQGEEDGRQSSQSTGNDVNEDEETTNTNIEEQIEESLNSQMKVPKWTKTKQLRTRMHCWRKPSNLQSGSSLCFV